MNFEEALEETVTKAQAIKEINNHHLDAADFFEEVGEKDAYTGSEVLFWLGY